MTAFPPCALIDLDLSDGWLTVWFNSPENRNALNATLITEFMAVLAAVKTNRTIRGITLRGRGGNFCSGGDVKAFRAGPSRTAPHAELVALNRAAGDMFDRLLSMPQVVIACVEGAAIAGGLGLMCCADIIIVTQDAKFALTETMIGIVPAQIAPIVVARTGLPVARRLMLTGIQFSGAETPEWNLSDIVVATAADFDSEIDRIKDGVMRCAPGAIGVTKEILLATPHMTREEQKDFAAHKFADCILSREGKEGLASFFDKRKPNWNP